MPELPEVQTIVSGLREKLVGREIEGVSASVLQLIGAPDWKDLESEIVGRKIMDVQRIGKWIIVHLSGEKVLVFHLRMTGRLLVRATGDMDDKYVGVTFFLDQDMELRFACVRKFARVWLLNENDFKDVLKLNRLGVDPMSEDFTLDKFKKIVRAQKHKKAKLALLAQEIICGLGNIYADECLHVAGIYPETLLGDLSEMAVEDLYQAIKKTLARAIQKRGTTISDFRDVDGEPGGYAAELKVYGRQGKKCDKCGTEIKRIKVGGRSSHFCPVCQKKG